MSLQTRDRWIRGIFGASSFLILAACVSPVRVPPQQTPVTSSPLELTDDAVTFLAFGDSGDLEKDSGLTVVSAAMTQHCETVSCAFALMAGDNIYPRGADGRPSRIKQDARLFRRVFSKPFGELAPEGDTNFRAYVALGNHDWLKRREGAFAQIAFHETTRPFFMDGPFYSVKPPAGDGRIEIFVLDTEMLLAPLQLPDMSMSDTGKPMPNGNTERGGTRNALPQTEAERNQLDWFKSALATSDADWKIVLAHHPLWESRGSKFAQSTALRDMLLPILCQYADAYIAGHQHTLEVHEDSCEAVVPDQNVAPLLHIVSGAAAKARSVAPEFQSWQSGEYSQLNNLWAKGDGWGFADLSISEETLTVRIFSVSKRQKIVSEFSHQVDNR